MTAARPKPPLRSNIRIKSARALRRAPLRNTMDEQKENAPKSDGDIISEYRSAQPDDSPAAPKKKRKRGIERHLYPCPHCGELILDHFTECPHCGGEVKPRGYHVDEQKRKKVVRAFEIAGAVLSVALVVLVAVLTNI